MTDGLGLGGVTDGLGGVTDGLGVTGGGITGSTVSVGDSDTGGTVSVGSVGTDNTNAGLFANLLGTTSTTTDATLGTTDGTTAGVNLGIFSGLIDNATINDSNTNGSVSLPALGGVSVNQQGTTLGLSLGLPSAVSVEDPTTTTTTTTTTTRGTQFAGLTNAELARYKIRCHGILANPGSFDKDLLALCRMISKTR
ncbi:MAG: hypothetical protein LJE67_06470 [Salaquimonas sp.]|nr:hypothetical protein [Salaquimonas sp.]